jgi:AraC-like DNA-binding protein/CheY-like chemotaxis protein
MVGLSGSYGNQKSSATVLIISDRAFHPRYKLLSIKGFRLKLKSCWDELDLLSIEGASIVIIDCGFQIDRGLHLLEEVKKKYPHIIVLILTDAGSEESAIKAFRLGARDYIKKPLEIFRLQSMITDMIKIKSQSREKRRAFLRIQNNDSGLIPDSGKKQPEFMHRVLYYIAQNLHKKITLEQCAQAARLSKYHFCRTFKKYMGQSPQSYITSMRIERARFLLEGSKLSVSEIGFGVGFSSYDHFLRNFKRIMGMTPKQYIKQKNI